MPEQNAGRGVSIDSTDSEPVCGRDFSELNQVIWSDEDGVKLTAHRCIPCTDVQKSCQKCPACGGSGWIGIDPAKPTTAIPGSAAKNAVLAVRYAAGKSLWHADDATYEKDDHFYAKQVVNFVGPSGDDCGDD